MAWIGDEVANDWLPAGPAGELLGEEFRYVRYGAEPPEPAPCRCHARAPPKAGRALGGPDAARRLYRGLAAGGKEALAAVAELGGLAQKSVLYLRAVRAFLGSEASRAWWDAGACLVEPMRCGSYRPIEAAVLFGFGRPETPAVMAGLVELSSTLDPYGRLPGLGDQIVGVFEFSRAPTWRAFREAVADLREAGLPLEAESLVADADAYLLGAGEREFYRNMRVCTALREPSRRNVSEVLFGAFRWGDPVSPALAQSPGARHLARWAAESEAFRSSRVFQRSLVECARRAGCRGSAEILQEARAAQALAGGLRFVWIRAVVAAARRAPR